jgi:hypothetical protein
MWGCAVRDIVSLFEDHDAVDALADRLIASARSGQASADACLSLMTELSSVLERLLPTAASPANGAPDLSAALPFMGRIETLKAELAEIRDHWVSYVAHWSAAQIGAERSRYSGETTDLMTVFKLRLVQDLSAPMVLAGAG